MTDHDANMRKIEDIRREHGAYISGAPISYIEQTVFTWEIQYRSGEWAAYGFRGEQPELKSYEEAIAAALKFYYDRQT